MIYRGPSFDWCNVPAVLIALVKNPRKYFVIHFFLRRASNESFVFAPVCAKGLPRMQKLSAQTKRFSKTIVTIRLSEIYSRKRPESWMARQTLRLISPPTPIKFGRTLSTITPACDEQSKHCQESFIRRKPL